MVLAPKFLWAIPTTRQIPRVPHPSAARQRPKACYRLDLHVLGLPPAFNLSHDQTLQFNRFRLSTKLGSTLLKSLSRSLFCRYISIPSAQIPTRITVSSIVKEQFASASRFDLLIERGAFYSFPLRCQHLFRFAFQRHPQRCHSSHQLGAVWLRSGAHSKDLQFCVNH